MCLALGISIKSISDQRIYGTFGAKESMTSRRRVLWALAIVLSQSGRVSLQLHRFLWFKHLMTFCQIDFCHMEIIIPRDDNTSPLS